MYKATIPQFVKMLQNMSEILSKTQAYAEEKKIDINFLLNDRLIADQFNFIRQVQIVCDNAKGAASRLAGKEAPVFEDSEKTVGELKTRVKKTIDYLNTFNAEDFSHWEEKRITLGYVPGKYLNAFEYLYEYALPNFYFHFTTAYSILRHNGVPLGKSDYMGKINFKSL